MIFFRPNVELAVYSCSSVHNFLFLLCTSIETTRSKFEVMKLQCFVFCVFVISELTLKTHVTLNE